MNFTQDELELIELAVETYSDADQPENAVWKASAEKVLKKFETAKARQAFYDALKAPWRCETCTTLIETEIEWHTREEGYCPVCKIRKERSTLFQEPQETP